MKEKDILNPEQKEFYQRNRPKMIEEAQRMAKKRGLKIGDAVAHSGHERIFVLKNIVGDTAIVDFPGNEEGALPLPLEELFNPEDAGNIMLREYVIYRTSSFGGRKPQN